MADTSKAKCPKCTDNIARAFERAMREATKVKQTSISDEVSDIRHVIDLLHAERFTNMTELEDMVHQVLVCAYRLSIVTTLQGDKCSSHSKVSMDQEKVLK